MQQSLSGLTAVPVYKGRLLKEGEYKKLPDYDRDEINKKKQEVYGKIYEFMRKVAESKKEIKKEMKDLDREITQT